MVGHALVNGVEDGGVGADRRVGDRTQSLGKRGLFGANVLGFHRLKPPFGGICQPVRYFASNVVSAGVEHNIGGGAVGNTTEAMRQRKLFVYRVRAMQRKKNTSRGPSAADVSPRLEMVILRGILKF